jgi:PHS family inorganic phosphate transporter-like MFS transporter
LAWVFSLSLYIVDLLTYSVMPMLGFTYFQGEDNQVPISSADAMKASLIIGMIFGQLLFGFLGDMFGRLRVYGFQVLITISGTVMVILVPPRFSEHRLVAWICAFRFITGVGIGGGM